MSGSEAASGRWSGPAGDDYDARFRARELAGGDVHGEARFVLGLRPRSVLDAGCGTGRVAIELARHGVDVVGVDADPRMLEAARRKAPPLDWRLGDLVDVSVTDAHGSQRRFDVVVAAGNVMIFVGPGSEADTVATMARHLVPGGALVAGFQLLAGHLDLTEYDALAAAAGLTLVERWSTWERDRFAPGGDYAVSVHRSPAATSAALRE